MTASGNPGRAILVALAVAIGGAMGAVLRAGLVFVADWLVVSLLTATIVANVVGSGLIGVFAARRSWTPVTPADHAIATGLLGGLTTFSVMAWEVVELIQRGWIMLAAGYLAGSIFLSLLACWGCYRLACQRSK